MNREHHLEIRSVHNYDKVHQEQPEAGKYRVVQSVDLGYNSTLRKMDGKFRVKRE